MYAFRYGFHSKCMFVLVLVLASLVIAFGPIQTAIAHEAPGDASEDVVAADAGGLLVQACGLGFTLPEGTMTLSQGKDRAYYLRGYDDGGKLVVTVNRDSWQGQDDSLAEYGLHTAYMLASADDLTVDEGGWVTYGDVRAYACGCVGPDRLVVCVVTAVGDEDAARLIVSYDGQDVQQVAQSDIADMLASLRLADDPYLNEVKRGRIMYYDLLDILGLSGGQILEVLEDDWNLTYLDSETTRGWMGADCGGPLDGSGCYVAFVTYGGQIDCIPSSPLATRTDLEADVRLSGMQVTWLDVPTIEWDEPYDAAATLQRECGLTDVLDDGYVYGWDENGAFKWMRVGRCTIGGEDAYWAIDIESFGSGLGSTVSVSADLLDNGYGGGFRSYDELLSTVFWQS